MPNSPANLLVPSSAAGGTLGYTANSAGIWISPPPPTIASISPAANAAASTNRRSKDRSGTPKNTLHVEPSQEVMVAKAAERFDSQGNLTDESTRQHVTKLLQAFVEFVGLFRR